MDDLVQLLTTSPFVSVDEARDYLAWFHRTPYLTAWDRDRGRMAEAIVTRADKGPAAVVVTEDDGEP